jgi:hypothetical protein
VQKGGWNEEGESAKVGHWHLALYRLERGRKSTLAEQRPNYALGMGEGHWKSCWGETSANDY